VRSDLLLIRSLLPPCRCVRSFWRSIERFDGVAMPMPMPMPVDGRRPSGCSRQSLR
jgi:hypothetical protein